MITAISVEGVVKKIQGVEQDVLQIVFDGELDETNVEASAEKVYRLIDSTAAESIFCFDFAKLSYMNSKSLGFLSDWYTKITDRGGRIFIVSPQPTIDEVLRTVMLDVYIPIVSSFEDLVQQINQKKA